MQNRREFVLGSAALATLWPGLARARATASGPVADAALPGALSIDGLVPTGTEFDAEAAIAGGLTAVIADLQMYPRNFDNAVRALAEWNWMFKKRGEKLIRATTAADIERARREQKLAIVLACQDASILDASTGSVDDDNLQNLGLFYDLGLRVLQITHNEQNALGSSFREKRDAGLSRLGEKVVAAMNELGMLIDLSHCGKQTTLDTIAVSARPCIISHAGCRALQSSQRNKTDEEIRAVAAKGGVFGIYNMSVWLTDKPTSSLEDVLDHVEHALNLVGEDHVSFGSDGPVVADDTPPEVLLAGHRGYAQRNLGLPGAERIPDHVITADLNTPKRLAVLAQGLTRRGHGTATIEKVIGGNLLRLIGEVCG